VTLDDGSYEAMCVDATAAADGAIVLSIAIVSGPRKGEVVDVRASGMDDDAIDLLAMPCVLTVKDGQPAVVFD
jgi:hypothetical protein